MTQRGQFVTVALSGDYGKPRPALVIQNSLFAEHPSVVVCLLTTMIQSGMDHFRIEVAPTPENGLRQKSQVSIDKIATVPIAKIGAAIGYADEELLLQVNRALAVWLSLA